MLVEKVQFDPDISQKADDDEPSMHNIQSKVAICGAIYNILQRRCGQFVRNFSSLKLAWNKVAVTATEVAVCCNRRQNSKNNK